MQERERGRNRRAREHGFISEQMTCSFCMYMYIHMYNTIVHIYMYIMYLLYRSFFQFHHGQSQFLVLQLLYLLVLSQEKEREGEREGEGGGEERGEERRGKEREAG